MQGLPLRTREPAEGACASPLAPGGQAVREEVEELQWDLHLTWTAPRAGRKSGGPPDPGGCGGGDGGCPRGPLRPGARVTCFFYPKGGTSETVTHVVVGVHIYLIDVVVFFF